MPNRRGAISLVAFFVLTFALTWLAWTMPAAFGVPADSLLLGIGGPLFLLGVSSPALVAIALTARAEGRAGVSALLAPIGRWEVQARWYVFALGFMAATKLTAAVIQRVAMGSWPRFGDTPVALMLAAIAVSTWVQAGEEVGWRGYALPRLARAIGFPAGAVALGVIWALWHLPLFILPGTDTTGQSFPLYLVHVTALSVAMAWLFWKTGGSLLLVMIMHAAVNNTSGLVPGAVPGAAATFGFGGSFVAWTAAGVTWAVAAVLLVDLRRASVPVPGASVEPAP